MGPVEGGRGLHQERSTMRCSSRFKWQKMGSPVFPLSFLAGNRWRRRAATAPETFCSLKSQHTLREAPSQKKRLKVPSLKSRDFNKKLIKADYTLNISLTSDEKAFFFFYFCFFFIIFFQVQNLADLDFKPGLFSGRSEYYTHTHAVV